MTPTNLLWQRLAAFELDQPGATLPFSKRLARENGWSHARALAAIDEYRRFVFLAMSAGHPVTPSDEVDQVWHLHLCYTRSYWEEMCGEILGRPLHHGPTRGGVEEGSKFDVWYRKTLASYERLFAVPPPADLWPSPELRFQRRNWRRIDVAETMLVSRRKVQRQVLAVATLVVLLSVTGCTSWLGRDIGTLIMILAIFGFGFLVWHLARSGHRGGTGCGDGGGGACGFSHHSDGGHGDGDGDAGCGGGCGD